jgi:hypothetical protein
MSMGRYLEVSTAADSDDCFYGGTATLPIFPIVRAHEEFISIDYYNAYCLAKEAMKELAAIFDNFLDALYAGLAILTGICQNPLIARINWRRKVIRGPPKAPF